jgi:VWFA-related protein
MTFRRMHSAFARYIGPGLLQICLAAVLPAGQHAPVIDQPPAPAPATPAQAPTVAVQVNVVNMLATVRDKHGEIVSNLSRDDFKLEDSGNPQTIRYFSRETDLPLVLGLLVDTSLSQRRVLGEEKTASATFIDQILRPDKDKGFVIHFDYQVEELQGVTASRQQLQAALDQLQEPQFGHGQQGSGGGSGGGDPDDSGGYPRQRGMHGGGTTLYDAVYLASKDEMQSQQGRKAVLVLSDGVDRGSKETEASAIEAAQRADTLVYSIYYGQSEENPGFGGRGMGGMGRRGGRWPPPQESRPDGKKILQQISQQTGGHMFEVSKKLPLDQIFNRIEEDLRNQYSIGFTPDPLTSGYHTIKLTANKKDLIVQTRAGYYWNR